MGEVLTAAGKYYHLRPEAVLRFVKLSDSMKTLASSGIPHTNQEYISTVLYEFIDDFHFTDASLKEFIRDKFPLLLE